MCGFDGPMQPSLAHIICLSAFGGGGGGVGGGGGIGGGPLNFDAPACRARNDSISTYEDIAFVRLPYTVRSALPNLVGVRSPAYTGPT